ncbi:anti-sigma factor family protein, partial [Acidobacteriota bacterium]
MSHKKIRGLLSAYLDGELDAKRRNKVKEHLDRCSACREEYSALEQLDDFSKEVMPAQKEKEYWESLPSRIKSGIEQGIPETQIKEGKMFKDSFIKPNKNIGTKAIVFPLSLTAHVVIALLLVILPLLQEGEVPKVEIYSAF